MKKVCILLFLGFLLGLFGCDAHKDCVRGNDIFTDEFFEDVVEISDTYCGNVKDEQIKPIISYLQKLTLVKVNGDSLGYVDENGDPIYGFYVITFKKSDGSEINIIRHNVTLTGTDAFMYVSVENLNDGLKKAFEKALSVN